MNTQLKNYGFQEPVILGSDFWAGGGHGLTTGKPILVADRDWRKYLPKFEPQKKQFETFNCTAFASLQCLETLMGKLREIGLIFKNMQEFNFSERFTGIVSGTSAERGGNDPSVVAENIRKIGLIPDELLSFDDSLQTVKEYYSPDPMTKDLLKEGEKFLKKYSIKHEWVKTDPESIWNALQFSPLGVSVLAWQRERDFYIKEKGERDNHWTLLVWGKYKEYWIIYDSYLDDGEPFKKLNWGYPFGFIKLYAVDKKQSGRPFYCVYFPNWCK